MCTLKALIKKFTPKFALGMYHHALSFLGALLYGFPSRELRVIGVTGTKGKTSTVHFIVKILEGAEYTVGAISGLYFKIGSGERPNALKMTMPGRFFIQRELRRMVSAGCTYAVIEVTSEGIAQHRARYIDFDTAVFTNIALEHLEAHGGFERYLAAKQSLFASLAGSCRTKRIKGKMQRMQKNIIVNGDDARAEDFLEHDADKKYCCHLNAEKKEDEEISVCEHVVAGLTDETVEHTAFRLRGTHFTLHVPGVFNVMNAVLAVTVGMSEGLELTRMAGTLAEVKNLPGRMERIVAPAGFAVFVDYAHTPDSLDAVYRTVRMGFSESSKKLICVLGATGGGRDTWKRPVLGAIAGMWGNAVIVTNEDPYDEDPARIMAEVARGAKHADDIYKRYFGDMVFNPRAAGRVLLLRQILDRREAIREALKIACSGDVVVISGKGSERVMAVAGGKKIPWDDREVVRQELARLQ